MSDRNLRRRARTPASDARETVFAPEALTVSPLAAFLDDAEAALCELRDGEPLASAPARARTERVER